MAPFVLWIIILIGGPFILMLISAVLSDARGKGIQEGREAAKRELASEYKKLQAEKDKHEINLQKEEQRLKRKESELENQRLANAVQLSAEIEKVRRESQRELDILHVRQKEAEAARKRADAAEEYARRVDERVKEERAVTQMIAEDAMKAAPYVAGTIAECKHAYDMLIALLLETKVHPSLKGAETVREYARKIRILEEQVALYRQRLMVMDEIFPWLDDMFNMTIPELENEAACSQTDIDPVKRYVSMDEYNALSECARNQLALDRYVSSHKKTKWQIGRDYEMYIAHLFRADGYSVECPGVVFRYDDCGRDVIVKKGGNVSIIQCKYWSLEKQIHENHIFQLYGTSTCYRIDHPDVKVACVLVTNTKCSERAKMFAEKMGVIIKENIDIGEFPRIKCNISSNGEYIYHLPMDQQYDNVVIDKPGEFYAATVEDAVKKGFRRAYRWHGG